MTAGGAGLFSRRVSRRLYLVLLVCPIVPVGIIWITATLALLSGCTADQASPCVLGGLRVDRVIEGTLSVAAAAFVDLLARSDRWLLVLNVLSAGWLLACCLAAFRGWPDLLSRLLMGFLAMIVCAFAPCFGPLLSIGVLAKDKLCEPNAAGIGVCMLFGGAVESAHAAMRLAEPSVALAGVALCVMLYLFYACGAVSSALMARK